MVSFCVLCKKLHFKVPEVFCSDCLKKLDSHRNLGHIFYPQPGIKVFSLYEWEPGPGNEISKLIYKLKGCEQKKAWRAIAADFYRRIGVAIPMKSNQIFYPLPRTPERCHARLFAEGLARFFHAKPQGLKFLSGVSGLKSLKRRERITLGHLGPTHPIHKSQAPGVVYMADDVVTTGATAESMRRQTAANEIVVFALAYRRTVARKQKL